MIQKPILFLLRVYKKFISPLLGNHCRFYPTCSVYMHDAIRSHGIIIGFYLGIRRLLKCQPFHPGGIDYVPKKRERKLKWIQKD